MDVMHTSTSEQTGAWSLAGVWSEGGPVRKIPIAAPQVVVGRWDDVDLRLEFRGVSKRHARLRVADGRLFVRDLDSTNGTYVNGRRIWQETELLPGAFIQFSNAPFQVGRDCSAEPEHTQAEVIVDRAMVLLQFDRLMSQRAVTPFFQPIVNYADDNVVAFEVLARSRVVSLETAKALFDAAGLVQQEAALSRLMRDEGSRMGYSIANLPALFFNMHPAELTDDRLIPSLREMRNAHPNRPIVLEVHEATVTEALQMHALHTELKALNIQLAYDDFGAGQARLLELVEVPPDYLKFDRTLIASIDSAPAHRQQMLATLVRMVRDLGIKSLAEGVECEGEDRACRQLGFELGQGFWYGRPAPSTKWPQAGDGDNN